MHSGSEFGVHLVFKLFIVVMYTIIFIGFISLAGIYKNTYVS